MGLLPLARRPIYLQPFELTQLARAGLWDESPIVRGIQEGQFAAILIENSPAVATRWTAQMLDGIHAHYQQVGEVGRTFIFRPRPRSARASSR